MENINNDPANDNEKMLHRRTIVKGAAWSLPVIAVAVAAPMAAASVGTPWDVSITSGCAVDIGGALILFSGFAVAADCNTTAPDAALPITETATGQFTYDWPSPVTGLPGSVGAADAANTAIAAALQGVSFAYAAGIVATLAAQATVAGYGPGISPSPWVVPTSVGQFFAFTSAITTSGSGLGRVAHLAVTFTIKRNLTVLALASCGHTGWGYIGAVLPPKITSYPAWNLAMLALASVAPPFGTAAATYLESIANSISPSLSLSATGNWADADNANHVNATINNSVLQSGC
ncbi:hypothetical protein [Subtercola endophyticus]|uniref:hypothetical protein n=1 Tax=Subtercola endophyticus TaxID=2895559 RepID=UPI001E659286|nr:hypothetical protein [Subtercola endophyticus]UFS60825.1 hypothetical protein LQ955_08850 [Subtercola endophyticus]